MPYKDPEHKRQWEREHREERNARRRRRPLLCTESTRGRVETPLSDAVLDQNSETVMKTVTATVLGLAFIALLLLTGWRFRGLPDRI